VGGEFWGEGYFVNTVGQHGSESVIAAYVARQGEERIIRCCTKDRWTWDCLRECPGACPGDFYYCKISPIESAITIWDMGKWTTRAITKIVKSQSGCERHSGRSYQNCTIL